MSQLSAALSTLIACLGAAGAAAHEARRPEPGPSCPAQAEPSKPSPASAKPPEPSPISGPNFSGADVDALEKYDAAVKIENGGAAPQDKAAAWRQLAKDAPQLADPAEKKAARWDAYAARQKEADETTRTRSEARDNDWKKLSRLLALDSVAAEDKSDWARQFLKSYLTSPGIEPAMAGKLAASVAAGIAHDQRIQARLAQLASRLRAEPGKAGSAMIEWVSIPGGSFVMGSSDEDLANARPMHRVTVKALQMSRTPVTFRQYKDCVDAGVCAPVYEVGGTCMFEGAPPAFQWDDRPVVCLDWEQAGIFAKWAGGRLPTEAEWEYAARSAGKNDRYPWGNEDATCGRAVITNAAGMGCGKLSVWPVCSKPKGRTEQGLCDMAGNVWTWIQDWDHESYDDAPDDASAWETPAGSQRGIRGGSWAFGAQEARSAYRGFANPDQRMPGRGLRLVRLVGERL